VLLVCGAVLVVVLPGLAEHVLLGEMETSLQHQTEAVAAASALSLQYSGESSLDPRVKDLGRRMEARITLIRQDGKVAADSEADPARMENHANRPEVMAALRQGSGESRRFSRTQGMDRLYVACPLHQDGRLWGVARLSLPLSQVRSRVSALRGALLTGVLIALGIAWLAGLRSARSIAKPVQDLSQMASRMAGGDLHARAPIGSTDELGSLARSFNRMADRVHDLVEESEASEKTLRALFERMGEGLLVADARSRIALVNAAAARMLRLNAETVLGQTVLEATLQHTLADVVADTLGDGKPRTEEVELRTGPVRAAALYSCLVDRPSDGAPGVLVVLRDVTEARRLDKLRRDFVANASHELRTPLASVRVMIESLSSGALSEPETAQRFLGIANRELTRIEALVDDLLALARSEAQPGGKAGPIPVKPVLEEVAEALAPMASAKSHELILHTEEPLSVTGDLESLRQALLNLLDNAIKYTPTSGRIRLSALCEGEKVVLAVEDTGEGIPPEKVERIFERFYRVDKARSRRVGGTGLGLSIVRHLVEAMGGTVSVRSVPGEGSRFELRLPRAVEAGSDSGQDCEGTQLRNRLGL
jgi:two-component system phosphate regulon sensor histidine kinase PhoR